MTSLRRAAPLLLTLALLPACAPKAQRLDAPIADDIQAGMTSGTTRFSHTALDALLKRHVKQGGARVDYEGLRADSAKLRAYLGALSSADLKTLRSEELKALLINAYNACTLELIVANKGVKSIREVDDPWDVKRCKVGGHTVSLNNIEHGLLRPIYKDPRVHFAVNCASVGCPPLRPEAFTGPRVEEQLERATSDTLTDPAYARVESGALKLTSILDWYGGDFTNPAYKGHAKTVAAYVAKYATEEVAAFIRAKDSKPDVVFLDYDWSLNEAK